MVDEARLEQLDAGLTPVTEGLVHRQRPGRGMGDERSSRLCLHL